MKSCFSQLFLSASQTAPRQPMASGFKIEGSLLFLEVELMETGDRQQTKRHPLRVASILRSGINGNRVGCAVHTTPSINSTLFGRFYS